MNNVVTGGPKTSKWPARGGGRPPFPSSVSPLAIARYCFYSGTTAVAPLLNLTKGGSSSDAFYKVAVAHLCVKVICTCDECDSAFRAVQLTALIKPNWCILQTAVLVYIQIRGGPCQFFRLQLRSCFKIFESGSGSGYSSNLRIRLPFRLRLPSSIQP